MRIIDDRTGTVGVTVSTPEEALLALSADSEERLARGLRNVWHHVHPDDAAVEGDDDEDDEPERRTVQVVAEQRPGVLAAALKADGVYRRRRALRWSSWDFRFDPFHDTNVMDWPRPVSELRGEAALAEATIGELAAHLNAGLRGDLAALLGDCADFVRLDDGFERSDGPPQTVWDRFRSASDLYEFDVQSVAAAIAGGPARWDRMAVDDWTPAGHQASTATPMRCAATCWGPLGARVQLTAAELLERYLAGDAELSLYRMVLDYGEGPTEFIWPMRPVLHVLRPPVRLRRRPPAARHCRRGRPPACADSTA